MHTIYTMGYSGWAPAQLRAQVAELGASLWDIRYSPRSRRPEWQGPSLRALLGAPYVYVPALGNRNYKNGGPIELVNPAAMIGAAALVLGRRPLVLLCGCKDWRSCHRLVAAQYLGERLDALVVHLEPPAAQVPLC